MVGHLSALLYNHRHHAYRSAACIMHGLRHTLHKSQVASAEHQRMPVFGHPSPQFFGHFEEVGVEI